MYALSTAPGTSAIAVIRISGSACVEIYHALCPGKPLPKARFAALRKLYAPSLPPSQDTLLDAGALVLYFPSPKTVTGEDVLELHVHGGPAIVRAVLAAIPRSVEQTTTSGSFSSSIRYAEPGEFTRRAFLNNRLDLTQVEALGETLSATTEQQRRLSVRGATRDLAKRYEEWRGMLLYARGELEALIDFSEDQHFDESPALLAASVAEQVKDLRTRIRAYSMNAVKGELLRNGINVALLGAPNAGKSSLLNRIVGREAAIVSKEEGTTRDIVDVGVDIGGWYCRLGDMAGLRIGPAADRVAAFHGNTIRSDIVGEVEKEGIKRAKQRALEADVVIVVLSVEPSTEDGALDLKIDPEVINTAALCGEEKNSLVVVVNKVDLLQQAKLPSDWISRIRTFLPSVGAEDIFAISCRQAEVTPTSEDPGHVQQFLGGLIDKFKEITAPIIPDLQGQEVNSHLWEESLGATERQRLLLEECLKHLETFLKEVQSSQNDIDVDVGDNLDIVVAAEELRAAAICLGRITGKGEAGDVEEVLGVVFEKFCVGK